MNNKLQLTSHERPRFAKATQGERVTGHGSRKNAASALILAVVLTSLLAIIGVMFVMIARVDKMATSAISENKELNFAVETVVALVSQELVLDVPGMPKGREYYDYPDANNAWLASLEPYDSGGYKWRQISDVYNKNFPIPSQGLQAVIVPDYQVSSQIGDSNNSSYYRADADGDGVADSVWVKIPEMTSNKGKPIYAAIRIVDNGGMINVNTACRFDPNSTVKSEIDGSNQTQINLFALAQRSASNTIGQLDNERYGSELHNLNNYIRDVVWRYSEPNGGYTPFDISDELELRNRFLINHEDIRTQIEQLWTWSFNSPTELNTPIRTGGAKDLTDWFYRSQHDVPGPNDIYSYRHIGTTYNMDRIIDPDCNKMTNINKADAYSIYRAVKSALDPNFVDANGVAAQIAVNLKDFRDSDSNVTSISVGGSTYYGFERPCVYISELAYRFRKLAEPGPISYTLRRSYAIELYKPYYPEDDYPEPNQWRLNITGYGAVDVRWWGTKHLHVVCLNDPCAPISPSVNFELGDDDPNFLPSAEVRDINYNTVVTSVSLERLTDAGWISVDSVDIRRVSVPWLVNTNEGTRSFKRDITRHKCIRRLWDTTGSAMGSLSLGQREPGYDSGDPSIIQAHPEDKPFINVGEIGMLFRKPAYYKAGQPIPLSGVIGCSDSDTEDEVCLNLADPNFQQLFKYLTVFDPAVYSWNDPNETRIKGRININTAPWYVVAQLPWISQRKSGYNNTALAQAIVAYRDKLNLSSAGGPDYSGQLREPGFRNIGELNRVVDGGDDDYRIDYYARDTNDLDTFPDLTASDGAKNDFEERDVIFSRISNLATVRSDVFTAYILVRIGADGPQKRVMAILDRSNVYSGDGKVRIVALHPVPDPR